MKNLCRFWIAAIALLSSLLAAQGAFAGTPGFIARRPDAGDNVSSLLKHYRFSETEREKVLSQAPALQHLFLQLDVNYLVKQDPEETTLRLYDPQKDFVFVIKKSKSGVDVQSGPPTFKTTIARYDGQVRGSVMANIVQQTHSTWVASRFIDAYILDYNLNRGLNRNAKYWLTVEKKYDGAYFVRYGEVLQTSLQIGTSQVQKRFVRLNDGGVFISSTDMLKNRPFYSPVNYIRIASLFQPHRRHPITKKIKPHLGVDFEMPEGAPIYAARSGVVVRYGHSHAAGNYVVISHGEGLETLYDHLRRVDAKIQHGLHLNVGEKFGEVGCTGYCTKAHLHFAVRYHGRMVDPIKYLRPYPVSAREVLQEKVAQSDY